ncbi:MAG: hypothetical protein IKJ89_03350 [Kiritimatiellae bacterium]|nr:hypothetical protein [Kiritimatiellia bacterium]MBR3956868.1 hypothetical protein [Kiritimatiellia bacterium]
MKGMLVAFVAAAMAGCVSNRSGYVNVEDDVYGRRDRLEYTQKSRMVGEMIGRMLSDPDFTETYAVAKERAAKRGHRRPTVVIREIEDNTRPGTSDSQTTSQMRKELKTELRKTKKFTVIDLYERERMKGTVIGGIDSGGSADNLQHVGEYDAEDFSMSGELRMESTGEKVFFHFFNLRLVDPVTGDEIWSDTVKIGKM